MPGPQRPYQDEQVSCEVCLKEIPRSEAKTREGEDYALYFCGVECFDRWERDREDREREGGRGR